MPNQNIDITNYVTINRKMFQHPFWKEQREYSKAEAWLDLIQSARFEVSEGRMLIGMNIIKWNRGEVIASVRFLVKRWSWSIGKVARFLDLLREEKMITTRVDNGQTVIMITNYNLYNYLPDLEHQMERSKPIQQSVSEDVRNVNDTPPIQERYTTDTGAIQERYETNNDNNVKKVKKEKKSKASFPPTLEDVIAYFDENGYNSEHASKAFKYYNDADWFDSKGNKVLNWKQKMLSVWFKEEGKKQLMQPYNSKNDLESKKEAARNRQYTEVDQW